MSQQFCLKWNNHTTNMLQVFENLLTTEALVDVTLACDGLSLKAHKMVLSACSPFFQSLFLENPCKHPIVIMKDMRYCDLKAIIDFMYRGEVNVSHDQLSALLKTAETLKVKGLAEVTGENKQASGIVQQEIIQQNTSTPTPVPPSAQRTDTPPLQGKRKRGRPRKRSLSDSNRSDDEGIPPKIKETNSDIEELSGDASMEATSDNRSGGGPISCNSQSQVPIHSSNNVNNFSKSHLSTSQDPQVEEPASGDENEFEVEPSKLLEQTLTTENVPSNSQNSTGPITLPSVSGLEISRRSMSSTDSVSQALVPVSIPSDSLGSNLQGPDSPQDVKPQILSFDDPPISPVAGTSHGSDRSLMMYMDQSGVASIPGPSNFQDNSALVPHDSQPQGLFGRASTENETRRTVSNHTCETTQLLQELKEDSLCLCHLNNSDFVEVINENETCNVQNNKIKNPDKSKQLIIFNEEGCMKGIEVNKEINSNADSDFVFRFSNDPLQETYILVETDDSCDYLNGKLVEKNISNNFEPKCNGDVTESDSQKVTNLMPPSSPQYAVQTTLKRKRRRGRPKKVQNKKAQHKRKLPVINIQNSNHHSGPYTSTLQQSFTQVSVEEEEVHVTKAEDSAGRPRRNTKNKTASEMLMLKRKIRKRIVESTSIEYQPRNYAAPDTTMVSKQTEKRQIVRYQEPNKLEKYGPHALPPGWDVQVITRKSGRTAGDFDIYFVTPEGKRLRSRVDLASYIEKNGLPFSVDEFCFRKSAYRLPMLENSTV